ncbi:hypothetical protein LSTR_LSTR011119 [Laodelphax striatellus]|uniref:Uncharacterized protein n=1 Tax=Laodelphax striatellus TaxID=195883 RepID=A0A482XHL2_LAOST|nr:hypothetical protein LSTR_LSTR011119 [Laodelphax striatellus]
MVYINFLVPTPAYVTSSPLKKQHWPDHYRNGTIHISDPAANAHNSTLGFIITSSFDFPPSQSLISLRLSMAKARASSISIYSVRSRSRWPLSIILAAERTDHKSSHSGDFRGLRASTQEIYLGEEHEKTKESSDCLRHLTHQAVVLQKKMNEIYTGKPTANHHLHLPPIHIQPPSMGSVLDMLNVINGILFVQISQQDIENFKTVIEKQALKESETLYSVNGTSTPAVTNGQIKEEEEKEETKQVVATKETPKEKSVLENSNKNGAEVEAS